MSDLTDRLRAIALDECIHDDEDVQAVFAAADRIDELEDTANTTTSTDHCPCGQPLDPTVHHDDNHHGHQLCEHCCPTCTAEENE
jgi:hypothetical protein